MNITIRPAKVEEAHDLAEAERAIAETPGLFCSQPDELKDENIATTITELLRDKSGVYLVAVHEGLLVGHGFLTTHPLKSLRHVAELNLSVNIGWQGKGIGQMLLESLIDWARKSDTVEKIKLNVRATNKAGIALYKKMGFTQEGCLKNWVKTEAAYIDDIIMGLDLKKNSENKMVTIREMKACDIDAVTEAFCFPWTTRQQTVEKWTLYFGQHEMRIRTVYLLESQGKINGYASLLRISDYPEFKNSSIPEINDVWISGEQRNKGLGEMMVKHLERIAGAEGYKKIGLGVGLYKDYGQAHKLHFRLGYLPDGNGITYMNKSVTPGVSYTVDDDLILWLTKNLI